MKKTLIFYTMNEIQGVKAIFDKIPISLFDQFFTIDYNSIDGTIEFLKKRDVRVIQQKKPGRANALKEGLEYATGDIIVNLSSDGNEDPIDIPKILKKFEEGFEMVTASRFMKGSKVDISDDALRIRKIGNILCAVMVNMFWGSKITDTTNGLRGFTRNCLEVTKLDTYAYAENFQLSIRTAKLGLKITEIPTIEHPRIGGIKKAVTFGLIFDMIKVLIKEIWIGKNF